MYLSFSDTAKFADIARNWINGIGYGNTFSFWSSSGFGLVRNNVFSAMGIPPGMPISIAVFFKIFGVTDFAVIATSFFYFILTLIFVYLLGKKIFNSKLIGVLSTLAVGASYDMIHYATNGASESPFIFEIVAGLYFASIKKKWASVVTVLFLILMYFTRPQAFIYIVGIILFWLLNNFKMKKALLSFAGVLIIGLLVDRLILWPLSGKFFLYSILGRGIGSSFNQSSVASDALRGAAASAGGITQTLKNIFYNLYNFYKAIPEIVNPYLFGIFVIGLFIKSPSTSLRISEERAFKVSSLFMVTLTFLITAASIPFYRYLHPIIPLVYILAVGTLYGLLNMDYRLENGTNNRLQNKEYGLWNKTKPSVIINLISIILILFFAVGQTVGVYLLDSRFEAKTHNVGKAPIYVELSKFLKENTDPNQVVVTNLDTWGSWYGERKTVWFPMEPKQLIDSSNGKIPFDAIYLTNYLMDDANYYMGESWREIFNNPKDSTKWTCDGCDEIAKEFTLKGVYKVNESDNYERMYGVGVLLVKKNID